MSFLNNIIDIFACDTDLSIVIMTRILMMMVNMMTFVHISFNIIIGACCVFDRCNTAFMIYTGLKTAQCDPAISVYLFIQLRQVYPPNCYFTRSGSRTGERSGESKRRLDPTATLTAPTDHPDHLAWDPEALVGLSHPLSVDLSRLSVTWLPL